MPTNEELQAQVDTLTQRVDSLAQEVAELRNPNLWKQRAIELKLNGANNTEIGKAVGKSRQTISAFMKLDTTKVKLAQGMKM